MIADLPPLEMCAPASGTSALPAKEAERLPAALRVIARFPRQPSVAEIRHVPARLPIPAADTATASCPGLPFAGSTGSWPLSATVLSCGCDDPRVPLPASCSPWKVAC